MITLALNGMVQDLRLRTQEESQEVARCQAQGTLQGMDEFTPVKAQPTKDTAWDLNLCRLMTEEEKTLRPPVRENSKR